MGQIYSNPMQVLAEAQPGDIIQFERGWNQSHCGIYAGNGKVIHPSVEDCDRRQRGPPRVIESNFSDLLQDRKAKINNHFDQKTKPLPSDEILKRTRGYNFGKYYWNSTSNHFAAEC
ncbi:unnamed protein product [Rotaria sordida]|uniref:LRAT domain-containing protein n=1 Tax=Rotaria sordida TaxID=392033 RepID=A0A815KGU3_9BILA|nr:unnamed protein product [Rotaria sordida]CAF1395835.1 unnamed protein product [Rotaria sordida]